MMMILSSSDFWNIWDREKFQSFFVQIKKHNCNDTSGFPWGLVSDARYNIDIYLEFAIRFQVDIWRQVRMQKSDDPL